MIIWKVLNGGIFDQYENRLRCWKDPDTIMNVEIGTLAGRSSGKWNKRIEYPMDENVLVIEAGRNRRAVFRKDLWHYRELFLFLARRDILVRYKTNCLWCPLGATADRFWQRWSLPSFLGRSPKCHREACLTPHPCLRGDAPLAVFFKILLPRPATALSGMRICWQKYIFLAIIMPGEQGDRGSCWFFDRSSSFWDFWCCFMGIRPNWPSRRLHRVYRSRFIYSAMGSGVLCRLALKRQNTVISAISFLFVVQFGLYISPVGFSLTMLSLKQWRS